MAAEDEDKGELEVTDEDSQIDDNAEIQDEPAEDENEADIADEYEEYDEPPKEPGIAAKIFNAIRAPLFKASPVIIAAFVFLYAISSWWGNWRLESFRSDVEETINAPGGLKNLKPIDDWRIDKLTPTTYRVTRKGGKYKVMVWRLGEERYLVKTVEKP